MAEIVGLFRYEMVDFWPSFDTTVGFAGQLGENG